MTANTPHPIEDPEVAAQTPETSYMGEGAAVDLRAASVSGGALTIIGQIAKAALMLTGTIVLARYLAPRDYGLVVMATSVTNILMRVIDLGLPFATVQKADLRRDQINAMFWVGIAVAVFLATLVAAGSPFVAMFFGEPHVREILLALSVTYLLAGLGAQHLALLKRDLRFRALATVEVVGVAASVAAAIVAAAMGMHFWALVIMQLALNSVTSVGAWIACSWRPGRIDANADVRSMLAFGGNLSLARVLASGARQIENALIGRFVGPGPLGLYNKAFTLLSMPSMQLGVPLTNVAVPAMSRLQDDVDRLRSYYRQSVQLVTAIGAPFVAFAFVAAGPLVLTLLGDKWTETVPFFRILAPGALAAVANVAITWPYIAVGQTHRHLIWMVISVIVTLTAVIIGLGWGAIGVAVAYSCTSFALRPLSMWYCARFTPVRFSDMLWAIGRPTLAAVVAAGPTWLVTLVTGDWVAPLQFVALATVYIPCYVGAWALLPGGLRFLRETARLPSTLFNPSQPRR